MSYLSWNWIWIQNLDRNRVVISKLAKGIWQILTWALESLKDFHFTGLLLSNVYIAWAIKYIEVIFNESKEGYKIWKGIALSIYKVYIRNLTNFDLSTQKSQILSLWGVSFEKIIYSLSWKSAEELSFIKLKRDSKFGEKLTRWFKIDIKNLKNFDVNTRKSQKVSL